MNKETRDLLLEIIDYYRNKARDIGRSPSDKDLFELIQSQEDCYNKAFLISSLLWDIDPEWMRAEQRRTGRCQ